MVEARSMEFPAMVTFSTQNPEYNPAIIDPK